MSLLPRPVAPIERMRGIYVDRLRSTPPIRPSNVANFVAVADATTGGVDVSFALTSGTGIGSLSLLRAGVNDPAQAVVLQTWAPTEATYKWSDTDKQLKALTQAYYWLRMEPANPTGTALTAGPQSLLLNPALVAPVAATDISASHAAAANGTVLVTVNVAGIPSGESVQIGVTGYLGNASQVLVAQRARSPLQFALEASGETITLQALTVSSGGKASATGPTCTLILSAGATVPARVEGASVAQIATGNQVMWPASIEAGITGYQLYRGQRGDAFGAATLLATIAASGTGTIIYLDLAGLGGDYQYFVIAQGASGNSVVSTAANPQIMYSSVLVPTNVGANTTNSGVLDSIDAGTSATIRIYGPGGVATSYARRLGFGTVTRVSGSVTGLAYSTKYYVFYNAGTYLASTTYSDSLPDGYEWVGVLTTCAAGGGGGGGGGGSGAAGTAQQNGPSPFGIAAVTVTNGGYGYGTASVSFSGGGGSGAAGTVLCSSGQVVAVQITNPGSGYFVAPTVGFTSTSPYTGGGGTSGNGGARYQLAQ